MEKYKDNDTKFSTMIYHNLSYENLFDFILNVKNEYEFF